MEFFKSASKFLIGTVKRVQWYLPPLLLDPFDIAERVFRMTYFIPQWVAWTLFALGWLVAMLLTYHELRMQTIKESHLAWSGNGWENVRVPLYQNTNGITRQVIGIPTFSHAIFANDPEDSCKGITAEKVVAHLEFIAVSRMWWKKESAYPTL